MSKLTSTLLDTFPYHLYADKKTIQHGKDYYADSRVWDIELINPGKAVCTIDGNSGEYIVEIEFVKQNNSLLFSCDCPYAENHFCKHMVAAGLELSAYLNTNQGNEYVDAEFADKDEMDSKTERPLQINATPKNFWREKLGEAVAQISTQAKTGSRIQKYAVVLLITKQDYFYSGSYSFEPWLIKAKNWSEFENIVQAGPEVINELLDKNHDWLKYGEYLNSQLNPAGCTNLSYEALNLINFFSQYSRYFSNNNFYANYFGIMAEHQIPIFLTGKTRQNIISKIKIYPEPGMVGLQLSQKNGDLKLEPTLHGTVIQQQAENIEALSSNPPWVLAGDKLIRLNDISQINLFSSLSMTIPEKEVEFFRQHYLPDIAQEVPIQGDFIAWHEINSEPIPHLYLSDDNENSLQAMLYFEYEGWEIPASKNSNLLSVGVIPESWNIFRIQRNIEREDYYYQMLSEAPYLLKRADAKKTYGMFTLRSRAHPFDFLIHAIPKLTRAGFEIFGEENLSTGKVNRAVPSLRVSISSGIDWFDLKTIVEFGDQQISFHDVRKAIKKGEHYIKLADGSIGQIPENWLEKYKHLWNLAQETNEGFRVSDLHITLLDSLLEEENNIGIPADLAERRERFRAFEQIHPHPLPKGFIGELRPYQKYGFDWLHFLHDYKFGGILADDMGLGKTIQMLVYLQSIKENHPAEDSRTASLLVVPKSLIINWQRESEKFTPGLRFYEYIGNIRSKDTDIFNDYDVILTTYGTMLRDYDFLRTYKFDHIILDESQSIKNPLSKSAKAARLLNAEHRLVMTGTPVENNTFELWSQFAFLNPGLLGSMEYFKKEFATPIESGHDEKTVQTLKQLVYPFILRRTKNQVAPELPPRTDRIIFTDMDATQKKLYSQTRERYRAELLGLVENEGMDQARFKILEGLLRLRQIAIHPALVDKSYHGDSPKFEILQETLDTLQAEGHKALVFSQFVETLHLIRTQLDERQIKYVYLDGQTTDRQLQVDHFQNDPSISFFLISLKAGGVGLNLTAADYVIHLDPWWNPAVEMQATDRAHRIGQQNPVLVYKIIARDTVEEKILLLQDKKRDLVNNLISSETSFFKSLTKDDIKMLFE